MSVIIEYHEHTLEATTAHGVIFRCTHVNVDGVRCETATTGHVWPVGAGTHMTTSDAVKARYAPTKVDAHGTKG
jgi:hypothetical protein